MAAYNDALPANGFSKGFSSTAPAVIARRVDQASKVAAPLEAMTRPFHVSSLRRFSARNSLTDTVMRFPGLKNAIGAGAGTIIGKGASGSTAMESATGLVGASKEAVTVGNEN